VLDAICYIQVVHGLVSSGLSWLTVCSFTRQQHCAVRSGLVGERGTLLATPAQRSGVDKRSLA